MTCRIPFLRATQIALLIAGTVSVASETLAQQPTQAQTNAIRQACRNDYMAHCSSVPTGGAPALHCLQQHVSSLSSGCQAAVNAIKAPAPKAKAAAAPAPAEATAPTAPAATAKAPAAQSKKAQLATIRRACGADYRVHCHGIPPGGGASIACLKRNAMTLSPPCQQALSVVATAVPAAAAAPAPPAVPAPATAPTVAAAPAAAPPVEPAPLAGDAARGDAHPADLVWRRLRPLLPWPSFRIGARRVMPPLQRGQFVAKLPGSARRFARGSVGLSLDASNWQPRESHAPWKGARSRQAFAARCSSDTRFDGRVP